MVIVGFWFAVMVLTLLALGLLLPPLLRRTASSSTDRRALERELSTLKGRLDAGLIDAQTYAAERERLSTALVEAVEAASPGATAPARTLAALLAVAVPAAALALYFGVGHPEALDSATRLSQTPSGDGPQDMAAALGSLEERLRRTPDDVAGWLLLARSYRAVERFPDMLRATSSAFALEPSNPDERELVIGPGEDFAVIGTIVAVFRPFHDRSDGPPDDDSELPPAE